MTVDFLGMIVDFLDVELEVKFWQEKFWSKVLVKSSG